MLSCEMWQRTVSHKFSDIPKEPDASLYRVQERSFIDRSFFSYLTDKRRPNALVSFSKLSTGYYHCDRLSTPIIDC